MVVLGSVRDMPEVVGRGDCALEVLAASIGYSGTQSPEGVRNYVVGFLVHPQAGPNAPNSLRVPNVGVGVRAR